MKFLDKEIQEHLFAGGSMEDTKVMILLESFIFLYQMDNILSATMRYNGVKQ